MNLPSLLALLTVFVALPLNWYVVVRLWQLSRTSPAIAVLRERAIVATAVAITVTVFGLVFLQNDLVPPPLGLNETKLITRLVVFVASIVPALYWLRLYRGAR